MPHATVSGVRLYYEEHGDGDPVLLVHGTGSSSLAWARAIPTLGELGRVIAYDRRGCHRSERPDPYERTSVQEHTEDARALLDALGAEPAIVIGRSYGGNVALDLALRYPASVRALALLEPVPGGLSPELDAWQERLSGNVERTASEKDVDAVGEAFIREVVGMWTELPAEWRRMFSANGQAILAELRGGLLEVDREDLQALTMPTLLVAGRDSADAFRHATAALAALMPAARTAQITGGHMVDPTDPAVLAFLSDVLARKRPA